MRRSLPTFLSAALLSCTAGLTACDQDSVDEPILSEDQAALFDFDFRAGATPTIPGYPGDGDLTIREGDAAAVGDDDRPIGDIVIVIIENHVYSRQGDAIATLSDTSVRATGSTEECTKSTRGSFTELRDNGGAVLYSTLGPWVFAGAPQIDGLSDEDRYAVLSDALVMSFEGEAIIDGLPLSGDPVAVASEEMHYANPMRKLAVTAMVDGACGGDAAN